MLYTISIVEDNESFANILSGILNKDVQLQVVQIFAGVQNAIQQIAAQPSDVVIVDLQLPDGWGIEVIEALKKEFPQMIFIVCTSFEDEDKIFKALKAGATGYIVKTDEIDNMCSTVLEAIHGGAPMSSSVAMKVVSYFQNLPKGQTSLEQLSVRENEVLDFLSQGLLYKEIAAIMN
jgi:two-component system, NarL family, response regulator LiaR